MPEVEVVPDVTVYWRPGCGYCSRLRHGLREIGLEFREVNIWEDPDAAAVVRSFASGNETVPTVVVRGTGLVNPSVDQVLDLLLGPDEPAPAKARGQIGRLIDRFTGR